MDAHLLDPATPSWGADVEQIGVRLHAGRNPTLFPQHFLQVVLPRLGGHIVSFNEAGRELGIGLLFPRSHLPGIEANGQVTSQPQRAYTLRYHALDDGGRPTPTLIQAALDAVTPLVQGAPTIFYDPNGALHYQATSQEIGNISIGRPSAEEAAQIPNLNQRIWGSPPESLYPADIHSVEFQLGTSLVARVDGQLAAFLFGFYKFGGPTLPYDWTARFRSDLRLESQTMGVLPDFRGMRIANLLKMVQAEQAWQMGIGVVHWTADPLQFPNAALNFGLLRALAFHFYPDLYPFRNELNRVPASRFGLTWLVGSERVQNLPLLNGRALMLDLPQHPEIERVNINFESVNFEATNAYIAIEIPDNWTGVQQRSVDEAQRWREVTDRLFSHYVGSNPGQYVITGVATDRDQRFLIGQQVNDALWAHLAHVAEADSILE